MASGEHHAVFNDEELEFEDEEEEDYDDLNNPPTIANPSQDDGNGHIHDHVVVDDEEDDVDVDDNDVDDSTSSSTLAAGHLSLQHLPPPPSFAGAGGSALSVDHINQIGGVTLGLTTPVLEEKKPAPIDESRRLFQRLWTDEDEIELLRGFLEYHSSRGPINSSHHNDTAAFYGQVKNKFQLDFNKNQLVEKLRRLKKKYRTIMSKITSGKGYVFKSPHEQTTFEISRSIWSGGGGGFRGGGGGTAASRGGGGGATVVAEESSFDDEDANNPDYSIPMINQSPNPSLNGFDINNFDKKTPSSRKRSRAGPMKLEEKQLAYSNSVPVKKLHLSPPMHHTQNFAGMDAVPVSMVAPAPTAAAARTETLPVSVGVENPPHVAGNRTDMVSGAVAVENPSLVAATKTETEAKTDGSPSVVEETVKNWVSPIFKELLSAMKNMNGQMGGGSRGNGLEFAFSPMPLGLNNELVTDEKWRKQQILELEVYSKRLELVQDQIKTRLEELKAID